MKIANLSFLIIGVFLFCVLIFSVQKLTQTIEQSQQTSLVHKNELKKKIHNNGQIAIMNNLLSSLKEEMKEHSTLKNESIRSIAALSHSFQEYSYEIDGQQKEYSPERGQLLLHLALMNLDSISFASIKAQTTFSYAKLDGVDLSNLDLSGINLEKSSLKESNFKETNLSFSNLDDAIFSKAKLEGAQLEESSALRANFEWANLDGSNLAKAKLSGSNFYGSLLRKASLKKAKLERCNFISASLHETDLSYSSLYGADFKKANLISTNLSFSEMKAANLIDVNLFNTNLSQAELIISGVEQDWFQKLDEFNVIGRDSIPIKYNIVPHKDAKHNFRLIKN